MIGQAVGTTAFAPAPRQKRKLPFGGKLFPVQGIGTFHFQGVGNTSYSCGYHVKLHLNGADESLRGYMAFLLHMREDGTFEWRQRTTAYDQGEFTHEHECAALSILNGFAHTDPVDYLFQVHGVIEPLMSIYRDDIGGKKNTIAHMDKLLDDPAEPRTIFVPKEESDTGKAYHRPRDPHSAADDAVQAEFRSMWRASRLRAQNQLETLETGPALLRYEMLKRMRAAMKRWSTQRQSDDPIKPVLFDLLERARLNTGDVLDF